MESQIEADGERPSAELRSALAAQWGTLEHKLSSVVEAGRGSVIVEPERFSALLGAALAGTAPQRLAELIAELRHEPTSARLQRVAEQARRLARRLGRGEIIVECVDNDLRLDPQRWAGFWSAFVHVVRNAVDHGLEQPDVRERQGKPAQGRLRLVTAVQGGEFVISICDDGRGIDWDAVRRRAIALGLPSETRQDLEHALTCDGLSTATAVTEFSGRGVGVGAAIAACRAHDGRMQVTSEIGAGTTFAFYFPISQYTTNPREFLVAA
jgi:two-component system chemotaxis sensor kinase CheA